MINEVKCFQTLDGKLHTDRDIAEGHAAILQMRDDLTAFVDENHHSGTAVEDLIQPIVSNFAVIQRDRVIGTQQIIDYLQNLPSHVASITAEDLLTVIIARNL